LSRTLDCLGLGIAPADILMGIDRFPKPGAKIDAVGLTIQGGGPIPTAMVTLARLGMKPGLIAAVGDDLFGEFVVGELKREKVDTSCVIRKKSRTAIASGWVEEGTGQRTIVLNLDINIKPKDIRLGSLPETRIVHLDGRFMPACLKLARWARRKRIPVVFDIGSIRNDVSELIPLTDHLVCAEDFALPFTGAKAPKEAIGRLKKLCPGAVVVTSGIKGSLGFDESTGFVFQKAYRVKAIDTTGAGDTYHGGYIFGMLKDWDLKGRMEFASAVAAMKCTTPGGRTGIPGYRQVIRFIKEQR
jgi:sulfofructose kinase